MLAERLMEIAQALIFELQRPNPSQAWTDRQTRKIRGGMAELDRQIGNRRPANQDPIYLGDIATGTTLLVIEFAIRVGYVAALDSFHWRETRPNLRGHVEAIENRPSFAATIPELMDLNISTKVQ